ncbi:alpha/beta fold hydrolase [Actinosynnema pretiosum subsp. pretiosum]|uniref:Alpha/beta fold hydrolase n=1 Tax=Actinosynnema pretiosum subsp. pretiosum TaxID=103721 RepID=A0AA45LBG5_9PSEU|nr:proteinase (secreted protein) [Actinosynnema pretiosum subsp. pretiosum]QUF06801.1 alpha/beta fold hydrolase [Actinosynnema pretiosum subsp. pretiosum]
MPRRRHAALFLVALSALAACSAGPSTRPVIAVRGGGDGQAPPTAASGTRELPGLEDFGGRIDWSDCTTVTRTRMAAGEPTGGLTYDCARMSARLDAPSRPGRGSLQVELLKVGSGKSALVVLGDPDGDPGTVLAARMAAALPAELLRTFTLIGMDRRGTGSSDGVQCVPGPARLGIVESDPAALSQERLLEHVGRASQECVLDMENQLTALDSWRTAADLEQLRGELKLGHLNAIGVGDGSKVLTTYAARYPSAVGRFVLDGAPDPTLDVMGVAEAKAVAAQEAFAAFAADCAVRRCAFGSDAEKRFTALLEGLRATPLRDPAGIDVTAGTATRAVLVGLAERGRWAELADALVAAEGGDGAPLARFVAPLVGGTEADPPRLDAGIVTTCNDTSSRVPPERVAALAEDWGAKHPLFGAWHARQLLVCGPFPVPQLDKAPKLEQTPPVLVVSTNADPVTPKAGTERVAQSLPGGVLVGWQGGGHGALVNSACAAGFAKDFLVDGKVPSDNTVCPP